MPLEAIEIARRAAEIASDKQALDIVLLDMRQVCSFTDFLVVCSGESSRQIEAIRDTIGKTLKEAQVTPHHSEGMAGSGWVLLDYGDVVIHIFGAAERDYYRLDDLWDKATSVVKFQ